MGLRRVLDPRMSPSAAHRPGLVHASLYKLKRRCAYDFQQRDKGLGLCTSKLHTASGSTSIAKMTGYQPHWPHVQFSPTLATYLVLEDGY